MDNHSFTAPFTLGGIPLTMYRAKHLAKQGRRPLCVLLALVVLATVFTTLRLPAQAAGAPTSLGLAEHGLMAYRDNWQYVYGGKGADTDGDGLRESDCAGLIYAYFSDQGALGNCQGGVSSQVRVNCVFSGDLDELYGIPRIHGLVVTVPNYNGDTTYSHIGIYLGNNMAADNSDYGTNMRYGPVVDGGRGWTAWHVFDNGLVYPSNGWYEFDGALYHYSNCQYDVDTVVDGITIGSDGIALAADGSQLVPGAEGAPALSSEYVSATTVADTLRSLGYDGEDNTQDIIDGGDDVPSDSEFNGLVTGNGVRLRSEPTTSSDTVATLYRDTQVKVMETVTGQEITAEGITSDQWYHVETASGSIGYVSSIYVKMESPLAAPTFSVEDGRLLISAPENCDIRYTTDGTHPTADSSLYTGPLALSGTYRAVAIQDDWTSPMATVTFAGGSLFTDFTSDDWYFDYVDDAVSSGLFSGRGNEFDPTQTITRAEFATALANLAGVDTAAYAGDSDFSDINGQWYSGAVNWVAAMGYMSGMGDGTFGAANPITREQICVTLANYAGLTYSGSSQAFSDDGSIASWAKNAVYACRERGLISGMGNNTFAPKDNAQRAQACVIILNAYNQGL